jgi:hypothetical protein
VVASLVPYIFAILDGERFGMGVDDDTGRPQATFDIEDNPVFGDVQFDPIVVEPILETG